MLPLPIPEESDVGLRELRDLVNADGEEDFILAVSWLVGALSGLEAYPIAMLSGEAGSGKSRLAARMRALVDPLVAAMRSSLEGIKRPPGPVVKLMITSVLLARIRSTTSLQCVSSMDGRPSG
jgi:hypothetical protein